MKTLLNFTCIVILVTSCEYNNAETLSSPDSLVGFWRSEKVFINGVDSNVYFDFLNEGTVLGLNADRTFFKNYRTGEWQLNQYEFVLKGTEFTPYDLRGNIIELTPDKFVVEYRLMESEYCCDFENFESHEVILVREVYRRQPN